MNQNIQIVEVTTQMEWLEAIADIQNQHYIQNAKNFGYKNGFLLSETTAEKFKSIISDHRICLGAVDYKNCLLGFIVLSDGKLFDQEHSTTEVKFFRSDNDLFNNYREKNFVYVDRIAVSMEHGSGGIGRLLLEQMELRRPHSRFLTAVVLEPARNERSLSFFARNGFVEIGELFTPDFIGLKNVKSAFLGK